MLSACGGGGGGSNAPANAAPTASAGAGQSVSAGATVTLNGSASSDSDGSIAGYQWSQLTGTAVALSSATVAQPTFTAPPVAVVTSLRFSLVVTDDDGRASTAATVSITVNPAGSLVSLNGVVRFTRVPFRTTNPIQLNYPNPLLQPARGVIVQALNATTQAVVASVETGAAGDYALMVPINTSITIRVLARMQRTGALPNWNVQVQDGTGALSPYSYTTAAFDSGALVQDVDIPLGIDGNGVATGVRASGAFAILDTIYQAIQTVLTVSPSVNLPALYVDWGAQSTGTFFTGANGQHIALMSDLTEDTDEFDRHTIAHEYGHYIEANFARSDSLGGPHGLGDRLDPRVAFGEGFAYAFAGIVLGDPLVLDSFVDNGQLVAGGFNIETNPPGGNAGPGCWCSESSVWSLAWDLYDSVADGNDNIALGFEPLWQVLTNAQRTTPAATSIFSFVTALKAVRPGDAAAIDALVAAQNIDSSVIDAFATQETHAPTNPATQVAIPNILPVYTSIVRNVPVVVRSTDDAGHYNKVGNRRFLRYTAEATGSIVVTVTTSNLNTNADPDFLVLRAGTLIGAATSAPNAQRNEVSSSISVTQGTEYLIDAYDCANGCSSVEGTAGDYDLTVVIN